MPALLTHCLCGEKMLEQMQDSPVKESLLKNINVFYLGTQGPDIFFYYGAWPWEKSNGVAEIGNKMHNSRTGQFFAEALRYIKAAENNEKELLTAYLCGYICHYCLDCHTHPYIYYKSGFAVEEANFTEKYSCYHRMFETALDVLMLKRLKGKKPYEANRSEYIKIDRDDARTIADLYLVLIKNVYGINISSDIVIKAISDMTRITALLNDKYGFKKRLLGWIDRRMGTYPVMSSIVLPYEIKDGLDYLNISHSPWYLPWDENKACCSSFLEMFDAAVKEASEICHIINTPQVLELIRNRSFESGIDCEADIRFKHFDCIFE